MTVDPAASQSTAFQWRFVPLNDYCRPSVVDLSVAKIQWQQRFMRWFKKKEIVPAPVKAHDLLKTLEKRLLDQLMPVIDWSELGTALDERLAALHTGIIVLLAQPGCDLKPALTSWAKHNGAECLALPSRDTLFLSPGQDWRVAPPASSMPWVVPQLDSCFLRHPNGLAAVRQLLSALLYDATSPGVIACDSWTWAYLQRVCALPPLPVFTLQALDGEQLLQRAKYCLERFPSERIRICDAHSGKNIFSADDDMNASPVIHALNALAHRCRGNPGAMWHDWRASLNVTRDSDEERVETDGNSDDMGQPLWFAPRIDTTEIDGEDSDLAILILHTLLLHNGLERAFLPLLLPASENRIQAALARLKTRQIIHDSDHHRWRVTVSAYPAVKDVLWHRGYLLDEF